jgi:hypothetical protein
MSCNRSRLTPGAYQPELDLALPKPVEGANFGREGQHLLDVGKVGFELRPESRCDASGTRSLPLGRVRLCRIYGDLDRKIYAAYRHRNIRHRRSLVDDQP